ncbi:MAG TPA: hypothetical protein DEH02_04985 [Bacteroidales bacterium]|nr:MAG: hypothetical protein A2X01_10790 [Bacteroidetes bacterium GWF2_35_48]HBX50408.1 hypothetical protein [Bacteroidales bacterium]
MNIILSCFSAKGIILLTCFLFNYTIAYAQPKTEVRTVWLTTVWNIDWPLTSGQTAQKLEMIN